MKYFTITYDYEQMKAIKGKDEGKGDNFTCGIFLLFEVFEGKSIFIKRRVWIKVITKCAKNEKENPSQLQKCRLHFSIILE